VAKGISKREHHKKDMDKLNRTALIIGGAIAIAILLTMVISFLT